jgi:hypothetical protein
MINLLSKKGKEMRRAHASLFIKYRYKGKTSTHINEI